ncbi:MAG: flagellar motor switch protein FliN [Deltaproteobacteria bacterium]|nr:flagellar motor switch protein FliN [Deltaproteobacteria bacterium]MBI3295018.1 flagellar motor switch protein FliN [Deltaproteobacteria bacterium]
MDETQQETAAPGTAPGTATVHNINPTKGEVTANGLEFVLDIPVKVTVEVGRTRVLVQDLLKLHKGSVIELSKIAGEPLEVLVNDRVVARGEVIVINEKFGIRLTDIVNHEQRIRDLGR